MTNLDLFNQQERQINNEQNIRHWLILDNIPNLQKRTVFKLLNKYPIKQLFQLSAQQLQACHLKEAQISALLNPDTALIQQSLDWCRSAPDKHIICFDDSRYPKQLKEISSPPLLLYAQGDTTLLSTPQIALVGSRKCTPYGQEKAYQFASELSKTGFTICSGLAVGIDGFAHQGALDKQGKTIAVLGTGLNNIYPKRHQKLAREIIEQGLLISEFWPNAPALPSNFPRRNRIISGLSLGVLVIEASRRSGSLITARYAVEQNRELFALPGSIDNSEACGCNLLIQQGAKLVTSQKDICNEYLHLNLKLSKPNQEQKSKQNQKKTEPPSLLQYIDFHITTLEQLLERSSLPLIELQNQLIELEINASISVTATGYIKLKGP